MEMCIMQILNGEMVYHVYLTVQYVLCLISMDVGLLVINDFLVSKKYEFNCKILNILIYFVEILVCDY